VNHEQKKTKIDSVYSKTLRAGKRRTYFFDVRSTKGGEFFLTISESVRKSDTENVWDRHKIFLYKEDFNRFTTAMNETVEHIKSDLMPHYDYDEFTRRQEEYEQTLLEERNSFRDNTRDNYVPREREATNRFHFNNKNSAPSTEETKPFETRSAFGDDDLGL
jgi:hypothetical protein